MYIDNLIKKSLGCARFGCKQLKYVLLNSVASCNGGFKYIVELMGFNLYTNVANESEINKI